VVAKFVPASPAVRIAAEVGANLLDADQHPVSSLPRRLGQLDLVFEATGASSVAMQAMAATGPNGICCLSSVTAGGRTVTVDADSLNLDMVLGNSGGEKVARGAGADRDPAGGAGPVRRRVRPPA
jgi:threonine dehydrogenase-like Zn-dependent dehydrogenase